MERTFIFKMPPRLAYSTRLSADEDYFWSNLAGQKATRTTKGKERPVILKWLYLPPIFKCHFKLTAKQRGWNQGQFKDAPSFYVVQRDDVLWLLKYLSQGRKRSFIFFAECVNLCANMSGHRLFRLCFFEPNFLPRLPQLCSSDDTCTCLHIQRWFSFHPPPHHMLWTGCLINFCI